MRAIVLGPLALLILVCGCSTNDSVMGVSAARDSVADYTVTFASSWSSVTHPAEFPSGAHFSGLIGATHADRVLFWREGQLASPGIQAMAELGSKSPLSDEIAAAVTAGTARTVLSGAGISASPGRVSLDFSIFDSHPLVSLVSMIAPSPDWFVGVADLPLFANGRWIDSLTVSLYGWDAGTDDGTTYLAPNAPAMPHVPVFPLGDGLFKVNGAVPALGTFTFVRQRPAS